MNLLLWIGLLGALLSAACGDSRLSPTAPSPVVVLDRAEMAGPSAASGPMAGKPANPGKPDDAGPPDDKGRPDDRVPSVPVPPGPPVPTPPTNGLPGNPVVPTNPITNVVQFEGLIESLTETSITVSGQTVLVPSDAVIRRGQATIPFSQLSLGDRVHVVAQKNGTTLKAREVTLENPADGDDGND